MRIIDKLKFGIRVAVALALAVMATGCGDDDDDAVAVTAVSVATDDNNPLRYPVTVTTTADCEVSVTYWPVAQPERQRTSRPVATAGSVGRPVIIMVYPDTDYLFAVNVNGVRQQGEYEFHTSEIPSGVPVYTVAESNEGAPADGYLLQWFAAGNKPGWITFCDMDGTVMWCEKFDQAIRMAHYNEKEGKLCVLTGFRDGVNSRNFQRLCDKIITLDLEGNRDINWVASDANVPYPHHDIKFTPSGDLIMVSNFIKKFDLTQFDLGADTEVWGDGFTIITPGESVVRKWNNFDELTPFNSHDVILEGGAVKDFLHANSVNWDSEGNYYMTFNRINELWKIEAATGKVLYRVGPHGNVALDESGYASGLHAAEPLAPNKVLCFDNGENRDCSRAIIYEIDPVAMSAKVTLSVPIPAVYKSSDRSNVQLIKNGTMLMFCSTLGRANVFTDLQGNVLKVIKRTGISYRSYYYDNI